MNGLPTACRFPLCAEYSVDRGYCKTHTKQNPYVRPKGDSFDALYHQSDWIRFSRLMKEFNPICQAIAKGRQCNRAAKISHHLISPKVDMSKFLEPSNIVCLCLEHHPNTAGEVKEVVHEYAPTNGILGAVYTHPRKLKKMEVRIGEGGVAEVG